MATRPKILPFTAALLCLAGCGETDQGPLKISAIGGEAELVNPNLRPLDPASAFLAEAVAQGLVRFDAAGEIEPALAQSWIVSDDGLRYTFRIRRTHWNGGARVTAEQVAQRLRAVISRASRNRLKPSLDVIVEIEAMTDQVLEISLKAPRPNFLQLLAQPEMAIIRNGQGTGPYRIAERTDQVVLLMPPAAENAEEDDGNGDAILMLRGESAAFAVARFAAGAADLVVGGTTGDLPVVRAAAPAGSALSFNPVAGLFGLRFERKEGIFAEAEARRALSMAIDRQAIIDTLNVSNLQARTSLVPPQTAEVPNPTSAQWTETPLPERRETAARTIGRLSEGDPVRIRVAMPEGPGYRLIFAHLRKDWRLIGVDAERVGLDERADLHFVDEVAPANLASWYLNHFTCAESPVCDESADQLIAAARMTQSASDRQILLSQAERLLSDVVPFMPIAAPVRWALASPRLTGFRTNVFARHPAAELIAEAP